MTDPIVPTDPDELAAPTRSTRLDVAGTALFCVTVGVGVAWRDDRWSQVLVIAVSMVLFAIGTAAAVWAYAAALERSRTDEIGVANLFLLTGPTAPRPVRRLMTACLVVQVVVALIGASIGVGGLQQGDLNPLAFGILVPMFGIGLNGLYAARHGRFGERRGQMMRPSDEKID